MPIDFDTPLTIKGHHSQKHDDMAKYLSVSAKDAIPMWVADMDFAAADCIRDALRAEIDNRLSGLFRRYRTRLASRLRLDNSAPRLDARTRLDLLYSRRRRGVRHRA